MSSFKLVSHGRAVGEVADMAAAVDQDDLLEGVTDSVIVLDHGNKIADAPFDQVCRQKNVIEAYLGRSNGDAQP